jgi:hypothetical protein
MMIHTPNTFRQIILIFFALILITASSFSQGSEMEIYQEIRELRTLGGHYFTPNNTLKSPFIFTHVKMSLGIGGINNIRYPLLEVGDEQFLFIQGNIFAALLAFEYQHAVKDWLAVYLNFGLIGRLGSDFGTLVQQGITYSTNYDIGWLLKLYRKKKFALSTSFGVSNGDYSFISLQNFVDDILSGIPNFSLIRKNNVLFGKVGLNAAYGFNSLIGVNAIVDLGYGETIQRELDNKFFTNIGFNVDLNLSYKIKTPISLSLGYLYSTYPHNNDEVLFNSNVILAQINYIGRTNFVLSLDLTTSREEAGKNNETLWLNTTMFTMRYLF